MNRFIQVLMLGMLSLGFLVLAGCDGSSKSPETPNTEPTAEITSPLNDSIYAFGTSVTFAGSGTDVEDGDILGSAFEWTSSIDGNIQTGRKSFSISSLSNGAHTITLTVTDSDGDTGSDSITVIISPMEPTMTNSIGMTFVYISPGTFIMGSPLTEIGRIDDETQHQVTLTQGYYMQTTEVTQLQWRTVMGADPSYFDACGDDCPVEKVSWNDAQSFVMELNRMEGANGYRLPTEAQWEYACRAGSAAAFANGDITEETSDDPNLNVIGWYYFNSNGQTHPVAEKQANAWGLYDMHGNVSEWCADWYDYNYPIEPVTDPAGPSTGSFRVLRGGNWNANAGYCRSAVRYRNAPDYRLHNRGFRVVLLPEE